KPDGFVIVPRGGEAAFLAPLPLRRLWGVGPKTQQVLEDLGMRTIGDLARADPALLEARLGEHGAVIADRAKGIDEDREDQGEPGAARRRHRERHARWRAARPLHRRARLALERGARRGALEIR